MSDTNDYARPVEELIKEEFGFTPQPQNNSKSEAVVPDDISRTETPVRIQSFDEIRQIVEQYLPNVTDALRIALAVATSGTRNNRVMLWMLLVGTPSSGKTDLVRLLKQATSVYSLDNLTLNAFISGERQTDKQKVYDLLPHLNNKCLVVKDWTVIFSLDERMTKKIIGDMVGAYDKSLSKFSSRRGQITYDAQFSHLGCITPATLNRHHNYLNMIGPRFLSYTIPELSLDDQEKSFSAIFDETDREALEKKVAMAVSSFLNYLNTLDTDIVEPLSNEVKRYLKTASRFMAKARGIVIIQSASFKNESGEDITYYEPLDVQIEQPWRAVQQLMILAKYLALVSGKKEIGEEELALIKDVVISSMPADRAQAVRVLKDATGGKITGKELADQIEKAPKTARRLLDELTFLGITRKDKGSGQLASSYEIVEEFKSFITVRPREFMSPYSSETQTPDGIHKEEAREIAPEQLEGLL